MDWRNSKLFIYGWLPVRLVASGFGLVALAVSCAGVYLMWFEAEDAKHLWKAGL